MEQGGDSEEGRRGGGQGKTGDDMSETQRGDRKKKEI